MRRLILLAILFFLVVAAPAVAQDASNLQQIFMDYCRAQGYEEVRVDSDGDVRFKSDDLEYYIGINEDDPDYANLVLYNIWPIESPSEMIQALEACNYVTKNTKVIKAYIQNDNVIVACEIFVQHPEDFRAFISEAINFIGDGVERFVEQMN